MAGRQRKRDPVRGPMTQWGAEVFEANQDAELSAHAQQKLVESTKVSYRGQVKQY